MSLVVTNDSKLGRHLTPPSSLTDSLFVLSVKFIGCPRYFKVNLSSLTIVTQRDFVCYAFISLALYLGIVTENVSLLGKEIFVPAV